jgi:hypothetical protein
MFAFVFMCAIKRETNQSIVFSYRIFIFTLFHLKKFGCSWLTRNGLLVSLTSNKIRILSDPQLSFMSSYGIIGGGGGGGDDDEDEDATATAAADYRWSMCMLVFDTNGDTVQFERDVDPSHCTELITKTIREVKC